MIILSWLKHQNTKGNICDVCVVLHNKSGQATVVIIASLAK